MKTIKSIHPGIYLKSIKPEALTNTDLAAQLNICRTTLWRFMRGERRLSPDMAAVLGKLTDEPARAWIERQAAFDIHRAELS